MSAVVLDLAARRLVAIEEIGDGRQLVRWFPARAATAALTPPEASVAELVRSRLGTGATVPVGELSLGDDEAAARWWKRFEADVVGEVAASGCCAVDGPPACACCWPPACWCRPASAPWRWRAATPSNAWPARPARGPTSVGAPPSPSSPGCWSWWWPIAGCGRG
ncbi:MAG: hypothetical protein R2755_12460 [Acidimicrobiales bacterium]